jgi:hypothetical protein
VSQVPASKAISLDREPSQQVLLPGCPHCAKAACFVHLTSRSGEGVSDVTGRPPNYDAFERVAVEVLKTRNLGAIRSLKKFLTALPSPSYIKAALLQAIYQIAEQELESCRWILHHRQHLEPELNLMEVAQQIVIEQLQSEGLILAQDFSFAADGKLEASEDTKAALLESVPIGDRLLIEEILFTH